MNNKVVPDYISRRVFKIKCRNAFKVERVFIKDEIVFYFGYITSLKTRLHTFWKKVWTSLSFFDISRFSKYKSNSGNNTKDKTLDKNKRFLHFLIKRKFGCVLTSDKHIFNFSSYVLSDCEKLVLSRGLNFCIPPSRNIDSVTIFLSLSNCFYNYISSLLCHNKICLIWRPA